MERLFAEIYRSRADPIRAQPISPLTPVPSLRVYDDIAAKYGFKLIAQRHYARFYLQKYLLAALDNGRWGLSATTMQASYGGLLASGTSTASLDFWLKQYTAWLKKHESRLGIVPPTRTSVTMNQAMDTLLSQLSGQAAPLPTLNLVSTPEAFGAKGDGATDDTAAFQAAIDAGDVFVGPNTYLINGSIIVRDHRNVQCRPGSVLLTTLHNSSTTAVFSFSGISYSSVIDCTFQGTNTTTPPLLDANQTNFAILVSGGKQNIFVGNTFKYLWANAALMITGGSSYDVVKFNAFESNAKYGVRLANTSFDTVAFNRSVDSSLGNEVAVPSDTNSSNLIQHNLVKKVNGNGAGDVFLTGGLSSTFNYGKNLVLFNTMQNVDHFYAAGARTNATYVGNNTNLTMPSPLADSGANSLTKATNDVLGALFGQSVPLPTLSANASTPQVHGAAANGTTDDTLALQAAVNAGDVIVPAATYLINGTVLVPSYRNIQCQDGAVFLTTNHNSSNTAILRWNRASPSGAAYGNLIGCEFHGTDTLGTPDTSSNQFNDLVQFWFPAHHNSIVGSTFKFAWGNAEVQMEGSSGTDVTEFNSVDFCDFELSSIYGLVIDAGTSNYVRFNRAVDLKFGLEADDAAQINTNNQVDFNRITCMAKCTRLFPGNTAFDVGSCCPTNFSFAGIEARFNYVGTNVNFYSNNTGQILFGNTLIPPN